MELNRKEIEETDLETLRSLLRKSDLLNLEKVKEHDWRLVCFDDNVIFDKDAEDLAQAARQCGANELLALSIPQLISGIAVSAVVMPATQSGVESFQKVDNYDCYVMSFDNCLLFSLPLKFVVLRTGGSYHTIYAGTPEFLRHATGIQVGTSFAYAVGDFLEDSSQLFEAYRPERISSPNRDYDSMNKRT